MSTFLENTLRTGVPFGIAMGIYNGMQHGATEGVASGLATGALFGVIMAAFMRSQQKRVVILREEFAAEGLVRDAAANIGGTGGWLFLTKQRLVFVAHKYNFGKKRVELALPTIAALREKTGMVKGIEVGTTDTERHTFTMGDTATWIEAIRTAVDDAGGSVRTLSS